MDIYRKYFGRRLKEALERERISQTAFAEKLGVNDSAVSRWTGGKDFPDDDRLPDILSLLKVPENFFLEFTPEPPKTIAEMAVKDFSQMLNDALEKRLALSPLPPRIWAAWKRAPQKARQLCEIFLTPPTESVRLLELLEKLELRELDLKVVKELLRSLYDQPTPRPKA